MADIYEQLGAKIRELRIKRGLSQAKLSESAGVSDEYISRIERARKSPSLKTVEQIGIALGVSIKDLFDFDEENTPSDNRANILRRIFAHLNSVDEETLQLIEQVVKPIAKSRTS